MERLCKNCKHARPPYDTSRDWGKKAFCFSPEALLSQVDGWPELTCKEQRAPKAASKYDFEVCGFDGELFEELLEGFMPLTEQQKDFFAENRNSVIKGLISKLEKGALEMANLGHTLLYFADVLREIREEKKE